MLKVSIIIPVYNAAIYLKECLDSVIDQTLKEIEVICVDDGSTDDSLRILQEYAKNDKRLRIIANRKNLGAPGKVRNLGLSIAKGEYIGFIDSDDTISRNYYEVLYRNIKASKSDVSLTTSIVKFAGDLDGTALAPPNDSPYKICKESDTRCDIIMRTGSCVNKLYRHAFLKENDIHCCEVRNIAEDNYFSMQAMLFANQLCVCDNVSYFYRRSHASVTGCLRTSKDFGNIAIYKSILDRVQEVVKQGAIDAGCIDIMQKRIWQDFTWFLAECSSADQHNFIQLAQQTFPFLKGQLHYNEPVIISLTSYPARIATVHQTIESLLYQSKKAEKVILWLAPEQFPNKEADLPEPLLDLCKAGLIIDWYKDIKSYKKLIPAVKKYPDNIIVTADDDVLYEFNWLKSLYDEHIKKPEHVIAWRARHIMYDKRLKLLPYKQWQVDVSDLKASYNNFQTGVGGVLYPPHCFHADFLNEETFMKLAPRGDDIWFWAMSVLNHKKIHSIQTKEMKLNYVEDTQDVGLYHENLNMNLNDNQMDALLEAYPMIYELIREEAKKERYKSFFQNWHFYKKVKSSNERRRVYICGIKVMSYNRKPTLKTHVKELSDRVAKMQYLLSILDEENKRLRDLLSSSSENED